MYVLLTQDVPKLGSKDSLVNVARGYFLNFLEPKGFAKIVNLKMLDKLGDVIKAKKEASEKSAHSQSEIATALNNAEISLTAKSSDKGTLFKGITEGDIASALKTQYSVDVDPSLIDMKHIKKVGETKVSVLLGDEKVGIKVKVEAE